jgi:choline dehydrogenase-like flavoprotein
VPIATVLLAKGHPVTRFHSLHPNPKRPEAEGLIALTDELVRSERLLRSCAALMPVPTEAPLESEVNSVARDVTGRGGGFGDKRLLDLRVEQAPNPNSRVTLSDETDALGMPKVRVDWQFTELDKRTWSRALEAIGRALGASGAGRLHSPAFSDPDQWLEKVHDAAHQMGTARMHSDPRRGVVDENCRVHGTRNLYVGGSAVFPTIGYANPTLTLVALAVRLATRLRQVA